MSSLFPKIQDNDLSMKVIRAYDACELMASNVNRHISARDSSPKGAVEWLRTLHYDISDFITDPTDVQEAVEAIDAFLQI